MTKDCLSCLIESLCSFGTISLTTVFSSLQKEVDVSREKVKAITYDVEYSTKTVKTLKGLENFRNIQNYGARAQELLEQLTESSQTVPAKKP